MQIQKHFYWFILLCASGMIDAQAATVTTTEAATGSSQLDLLQHHLDSSSTTGTFNQESSAGESVLVNGTVPLNYEYEKSIAVSGITSNSNIIYTLDTSGNRSSGYSISCIDIYHGWSSEGRDQGKVVISYATVAAPTTYVEIVDSATAVYDPPTSSYGRMRITPSSGNSFATGIAKLLFTFPSQENGYAGYSEIDVFGQLSGNIWITQSNETIEVDEGGSPSSDSYQVELLVAPTANVIVTPSWDGSQISVTPSSLTFTTSNYATAQAFTVTAVDDALHEIPRHTSTISHTVSSADGNYNGVTMSEVVAQIADDDEPLLISSGNTNAEVDCSSIDLLQTALSSVQSLGVFDSESSGGAATLYDGIALIATGNPSYSGNTELRAAITSTSSIIFTLNTTAKPNGYTINTIDLYHGWSNDGRDEGRVTIQYSKVSAPDAYYDLLTNCAYDPASSYGRMRFMASSQPYLCTNVAKIKFIFPATQENNYSGYSEIDVFGFIPIGTIFRID
jgi:hypothetical protein